ncbi:MAG: hypothetical protein IKB10_03355 [Alphaproteobacteria bacterium]|nr:hypothetical protein [Alphaproteobacteria bacterium]
MQKILKISAVSMLAIVAASGANAAGYTCEELVEYTSCNPGYYLELGDSTCPDDYTFKESLCCYAGAPDDCDDGTVITQSQCEEEGHTFYARVCYSNDEPDDYDDYIVEPLVIATTTCKDCPAGYSCSGGDAAAKMCASGTYQPSTGQTSCLTTPAGNYSGTGAVNYTACATGSYQPSAGQSSCMTCPAGSECPTTTAATLCEAGEYAPAGSTACSTCPTHAYTNASGQRVTVPATSVAGAGSATACYIDPDTYFTDAAGTYHFKENCELKVNYIATDAETSAGACDNEGYVFAYDYVYDENGDDISTPMCFLVTYSECMNMAKKMEEEWPDENVITWNESTNTCECASSWESDGGLYCAY